MLYYLFPDDIGSNVDGANAAAAQAKSQLVQAAKSKKSNSSLVSYGYVKKTNI